MSRLGRVAHEAWEFVVGEDWVLAAAAALSIGAAAVLAGLGLPAWWVTGVGVLAGLVISLRRTAGR